jgi:hypothetical protein
MEASPEAMISINNPPVNEAPAESRIPNWEQIPVEKRQELTQILAGMLLKQVQESGVNHEQPS